MEPRGTQLGGALGSCMLLPLLQICASIACDQPPCAVHVPWCMLHTVITLIGAGISLLGSYWYLLTDTRVRK
jgi:hypothetical protein